MVHRPFILNGVVRYVRWYCPDEDVWAYDELDDEGWTIRHVEVRRGDGTVTVAASLVEVLKARDSGGIDAVRHYEQRYGVVPEATFPGEEPDVLVKATTPAEFEQLWSQGRSRLG